MGGGAALHELLGRVGMREPGLHLAAVGEDGHISIGVEIAVASGVTLVGILVVVVGAHKETHGLDGLHIVPGLGAIHQEPVHARRLRLATEVKRAVAPDVRRPGELGELGLPLQFLLLGHQEAVLLGVRPVALAYRDMPAVLGERVPDRPGLNERALDREVEDARGEERPLPHLDLLEAGGAVVAGHRQLPEQHVTERAVGEPDPRHVEAAEGGPLLAFPRKVICRHADAVAVPGSENASTRPIEHQRVEHREGRYIHVAVLRVDGQQKLGRVAFEGKGDAHRQLPATRASRRAEAD